MSDQDIIINRETWAELNQALENTKAQNERYRKALAVTPPTIPGTHSLIECLYAELMHYAPHEVCMQVQDDMGDYRKRYRAYEERRRNDDLAVMDEALTKCHNDRRFLFKACESALEHVTDALIYPEDDDLVIELRAALHKARGDGE